MRHPREEKRLLVLAAVALPLVETDPVRGLHPVVVLRDQKLLVLLIVVSEVSAHVRPPVVARGAIERVVVDVVGVDVAPVLLPAGAGNGGARRAPRCVQAKRPGTHCWSATVSVAPLAAWPCVSSSSSRSNSRSNASAPDQCVCVWGAAPVNDVPKESG